VYKRTLYRTLSYAYDYYVSTNNDSVIRYTSLRLFLTLYVITCKLLMYQSIMLYQDFALHPYGVAIATMFTCRFLCRLIIQRHWDFMAPSVPSQA